MADAIAAFNEWDPKISIKIRSAIGWDTFFFFMNSAGLGADEESGGMKLNDSVAERKIYWRKNCSKARGEVETNKFSSAENSLNYHLIC